MAAVICPIFERRRLAAPFESNFLSDISSVYGERRDNYLKLIIQLLKVAFERSDLVPIDNQVL